MNEINTERKPNHWLRRLYVVAALLVLAVPAKLLWDVYLIPDYRGGNAYVSTSPDGMYKGMDMFMPEDRSGLGGSLGLLMSLAGYDLRVVVGLADVKTGQMVAYVPILRSEALSTGDGGIWECVDRAKGPCVRFQSSFSKVDLNLPPCRWHRLVAWIAAELRGLGALDFGQVKEDRFAASYTNEYGER